MEHVTAEENQKAGRKPAPVSKTDRIQVLDVLRGIALLGILLINIPVFSLPHRYSEAFRTDPHSINFWLMTVINVLFEGKMRALFSMLFGAGILLFSTKKTEGKWALVSLFYRRMGWLVIFGLADAHLLLWEGDILYFYGIIGMIAFIFRKVKPMYLALGVPLAAVLEFVFSTLFYQEVRQQRLDYLQVMQELKTDSVRTDRQREVIAAWRESEKNYLPNEADIKEHTAAMKSGYATVAATVRPLAWNFEFRYLPYGIWDPLVLMLLGMALVKWGFFTGSWTKRQYLRWVWLGYGLGLPIVLYESYNNFVHFPDLKAFFAYFEANPIPWRNLAYPVQRILLMMAHISLVMLLYLSGRCGAVFRRLAAVGQMALTNYVMQAVICTLFFFGYGLNYFGELGYYQVFYVVAGVWVVQLTVSPLWLRWFHFGPLEWLWRSLTYLKVQPMFPAPTVHKAKS